MEATTANLIQAIDRERIKRKMNHSQFSSFLGIDPTYWHRLRTGERTPNLNMLTNFMQKLPEITPEVTIFFMSQGNDGGGGKTIKKSGDKNPSDYLGHGKTILPPKKPSKKAV